MLHKRQDKTIDSNLRKKPDSGGTSAGLIFLWVRVCCRLLSTLSNNFAAGHVTGTAACVQTTCMLIRAKTEPSGILTGLAALGRAAVSQTTQPMARLLGGGTSQTDQQQAVRSFRSTFSLHARAHVRSRGARYLYSATRDPGGGARSRSNTGAAHHSTMYLTIPKPAACRWLTNGDRWYLPFC